MYPGWLDRLQRGSLLVTALLYSAGYGAWGLLLLLLTVVVEAVVTRRPPWTSTRLDWLLAAFLGAFLVSGFLSPYRPVAVGSIGLASLTIYLAFGGTAAVLRRDPSFLRPLAVAWVVGAVAAALWGIVLHRATGAPASTSSLGQNALGTTLLIAVILGVGLVIDLRGLPRWLLAACSVVLFVGVVVTYARGAWLGTIIGGTILLSVSGIRKLAAGTLAGVLVVIAVLAMLGSERGAIISRVAAMVDPSANRDRLLLIRTSLVIFAAHPVSGTGFGTFPLVYPTFRVPNDPNPLPLPFAHNIFANMAAEGGVLGFGTFAAVVAGGIYGGWQWHRSSREGTARLPVAFLAAFVGAMVHQLFDGTLLSVHLGLGMWVLLAALGVGWTRAAGLPGQRRWTSA
jgi:O-antigen ligase